jgi:hypothetical protein
MEGQKKKAKAKSRFQNQANFPPPPPMNPALMQPLSFGVLDSTDCISTAVPVGNFVYPEATMAAVPNNHSSIRAAASTSYTQESTPVNISGISSHQLGSDYQNLIAAESMPLNQERDISTATYIPSYDDNTAERRALDEKMLTGIGTAVGKLKSSDSDDAVKHGLRNSAYSIEWHMKEKIRKANKNGGDKNKEGFATRNDDPSLNQLYLMKEKNDSKQPNTIKSQQNDTNLKGTGGYEISEYKTADYSTVNYDVKEYESIYDA